MRFSLSTLLVPALVAYAAAAGCAADVGGGGGGSAGTSNVSDGGSGGTGGAGTGGMGGAGGTGGTGGAGGAGAGPTGCVVDGDCANDPGGTICNADTGKCVECIPSGDPLVDDCGLGQYCNKDEGKCKVGCTHKADCLGAQVCDTMKNQCSDGCIVDTDCFPGSICISKTCIPGCSATQPCQAGFSCCSSSCYDFSNDENNCGFCNNSCSNAWVLDDTQTPPVMGGPPNGTAVCDNGLCSLGACKPGFSDCNNDPSDGCEWNTLQDGPCTCVPGQTQSCYQGLPGTLGIGPCKAGTQTCKEDGSGWGDCKGQVLPKYEICANAIDDDCNGAADDSAGDFDGDGYSSCGGGDCCDFLSPGCPNPKAVNPGAFEFTNDGVDNDCDPTTPDNVEAPPCSSSAKFAAVTAEDVAKAMELCQFVPENPPAGEFKKWGVLGAKLVLADGSTPTAAQLSVLQDKSTAILTGYGTVVKPQKGLTMAGISSGVMRDQDDVGYTGTSTSHSINGNPPATYLLANGGKLPSSQGCNGSCSSGTGANDSINVRLDIRVPTNAKSFEYQFRFFSSEYKSWQCSSYNDFFLALLQSGAMGLPTDKNIAKDGSGNPVSVNNSLFQVCVAKGCNTCPSGSGELTGTGMQLDNVGGGTDWLFNTASVVPGEKVTLELMIFDVTDTILDSLVLLDNFRWNAADLGTGIHE
ncbi:choice-of-anchor L domain-containing protein [Polyangium jinanense]|uniref:Choice-of-anchor L domain-containing protein n=1 Tax=Polyangium jinanense TaxID=2829994 RepID=A0A9X3X6V6_9BACT|nr:choice-of-anchor L domain-containing protein [Polyangium jinanense]MDC3979888.1 choice-of-anchor L domain-containing protein [Polyangium jinanense]MDC3982541.1 choice-of-anchor L domain-containing protein [Polyangium jinanense]